MTDTVPDKIWGTAMRGKPGGTANPMVSGTELASWETELRMCKCDKQATYRDDDGDTLCFRCGKLVTLPVLYERPNLRAKGGGM